VKRYKYGDIIIYEIPEFDLIIEIQPYNKYVYEIYVYKGLGYKLLGKYLAHDRHVYRILNIRNPLKLIREFNKMPKVKLENE
jgi:hypothetical protein